MPKRFWTQDKILQIITLWKDETLSVDQIAAELGTTKSSVDKFAHRNRDTLPKRGHQKKSKPVKFKLVPKVSNQYKKYTDIKIIHKCRRLFEAGYSTPDICELAEVSQSTFYKMRKYAPKYFIKVKTPQPENIIPVKFAPPGKGYYLKSNGGYLHLSGKTLTLNSKYAWRGTEYQCTLLMKTSPFKKLIAVREY